MATGGDVLSMLCPDKEWTIYGNDFETIIWHKGKASITQEEFEAGFAQYDDWKSKQDAASFEAKNDLLTKLGVTAEEIKLLLA